MILLARLLRLRFWLRPRRALLRRALVRRRGRPECACTQQSRHRSRVAATHGAPGRVGWGFGLGLRLTVRAGVGIGTPLSAPALTSTPSPTYP